MSENITKEEFYNLLDDWISKPKESWNHVTLVAYFYWKFYNKNGVHYTPTRWSGNPASSKECRDIAKVFNCFVPNNYKDLEPEEKKQIRKEAYLKIYNYINWMFDYKQRFGDNSIAITTQFFLAPYALNEFQIMYNQAVKKIDSKNQLEELKGWCKKEIPEILECHQLEKPDDIILINKYADMYNLLESSGERRLINQAVKMGIIR